MVQARLKGRAASEARVISLVPPSLGGYREARGTSEFQPQPTSAARAASAIRSRIIGMSEKRFRDSKGFKLSAIFGSGSERAPLSDKFTAVYQGNLWKGTESVSGPGSDLAQTEVIRTEIPKLLERFSIRSMIDAPCGDYFWMKQVDLGDVHYTGLDIVEALVERNNRQFADATHVFRRCNIVEEGLPEADLILSRDCLVHLSYRQTFKAIANFKSSKARYLLTTTFHGRTNHDLGKMVWRPLDLCHPPFNFPEPEVLINEKCTEHGGICGDKSLGLWDLKKIRLSSVALV